MEFFKEVAVGEINLGRFLISELDDENIWIALDRGEGSSRSLNSRKLLKHFTRRIFDENLQEGVASV